MEAGDIIEVSNKEDFSDKFLKQREFITMTSDNYYLCWNYCETDAVIWKHGREIANTKTIYEWMFKEDGSWYLGGTLETEEDAGKLFNKCEYKKTGRSWEVPDDNS